MKIVLYVLLFIFFAPNVIAAEFGEYQYSKYLGIHQQLQNQKTAAMRRQMKYNSNPTRNIRYPRTSNSYPNIEKRQLQKPLNANQRYSSAYYSNYANYRN